MESNGLLRALISVLIFLFMAVEVFGESVPVSELSSSCLECHSLVTPGIVSDWKASVHSRTSVAQAGLKETIGRSYSPAGELPSFIGENVAVGCAECHMVRSELHPDTFEHGENKVHTIVTPEDCAVCHKTEATQFRDNMMSHAYGNLLDNKLYGSLIDAILTPQTSLDPAHVPLVRSPEQLEDSCLSCHGTKVTVKEERKSLETSLGTMAFPMLEGWPNQGVGRINPDGSMGCCSSCHTRHRFAVAVARQPEACSTCHKGPDVPAYPVYKVSKHGVMAADESKTWNLDAIPWTVGKDFTAPTCATCHMSLIVDEEDEIVVPRTHQVSDRLPWRLFGPLYVHPHPKSPDTAELKNSLGIQLPTELSGKPVREGLIDRAEQASRQRTMEAVCRSCHSTQWTRGHFTKLDGTITETNERVRQATDLLSSAWLSGIVRGIDQKDSIFNEPLERDWVQLWLFYANSVRLSSAMGGADYGVFANGRWYLSKALVELDSDIKKLTKESEPKSGKEALGS